MDEGLCWVVVIGSFLSQFTAFGFHNTFGQLYVELLAEFGESKAVTGLLLFYLLGDKSFIYLFR